MDKKYSYFISYILTNGKDTSYSNNVIDVCFKIKKYDDIKLIQDIVSKQNGYQNMIILNYQLIK